MSIEFSIEQRYDGRARLAVQCDRSSEGVCRFSLWQKPAAGITWQWDGNVEHPTIAPSVNCQGGCGRHFTITAGVAA